MRFAALCGCQVFQGHFTLPDLGPIGEARWAVQEALQEALQEAPAVLELACSSGRTCSGL